VLDTTQKSLEKPMPRYSLGKTDEIPLGSSKLFTLEGEKVLVFHLQDGYYATQSHCTHLFMPLKNGKIIEGCKLRCPFHRAEFDIRTGEPTQWANFPPGIQLVNKLRQEKALRTYQVKCTDDQLFITLPDAVEHT